MRKVKVWSWHMSRGPSCCHWPANILTQKMGGEGTAVNRVPSPPLCVSELDSLGALGHLTFRIIGETRLILAPVSGDNGKGSIP